MIGASKNIKKGKTEIAGDETRQKWRDSLQPLLKQTRPAAPEVYNLNPYHSLGNGKIFKGFSTLTDWIIENKTVLIDGYVGVFFDDVQEQIQRELDANGVSVKWNFVADHFKTEAEIETRVSPFLGGGESVWGTRTDLELKDFLNLDGFLKLVEDRDKEVNIVIGTGAGLLEWDAPVIYFDIPKNEIQYRMRAGSVTNLGRMIPEKAFHMYKRFYFVDWVVCNAHRSALMKKISVIADGQWLGEVNWMFKESLAEGLNRLGRTVLRARPWFESGSWGGQWMKGHLENLPQEEVNYAWSFELISPENGIVFESEGNLLEVPFDLLMQFEYKAVLGKQAEKFGPYFPIRFDFLDTFSGGNLSIQCHPSKKYIRENFGETITQDETYYILDCAPDAKVYLGFQEDIDPVKFRAALEESKAKNQKMDIEKYVQSFPSHKHELFLIPNGTVHSSGVNNMVLEISATPYIFTFKMYDWLSLDLNGQPRPINIDHAFNNLKFERKGNAVPTELISRQTVTDEGADWQLVHLPTHADHFYDIDRIEFDTEFLVDTAGSCHVLMLVEGSIIAVELAGEPDYEFNYAETFIIPAAAKKYKLINKGQGRAKVIKAFLKEDIEL